MITQKKRIIPLRAYWTFCIKTNRSSIIKIKLPDAQYWWKYPFHRKVTLYPYLPGGGLSLKKHCRFHAGFKIFVAASRARCRKNPELPDQDIRKKPSTLPSNLP